MKLLNVLVKISQIKDGYKGQIADLGSFIYEFKVNYFKLKEN